MAERSEHAEANGALAVLRRLRREMEALRRALEREEERADSVVQDLIALEEAMLTGGASKPVSISTQPAKRRNAPERAFLLQLAAQSGVHRLEIKRLANGEASVRVDDGKAFGLSATLSALLETLALDNAQSDGEIVGWKTIPEVIGHLQGLLGRVFTPHAVHQLVSRLRAALADNGGVNPFLVQTHRQSGLRFALRRQPRL